VSAAFRAVRIAARKVGIDVRRLTPERDHGMRVAKLCDSGRVDILVDVGAHQGAWASDVRAGGYRGQIMSFEPQPAIHELLKRRSSSDPAWRTYPLALGASDGMIDLHISGAYSTWASTLEAGMERPETKADHVQAVPIRRLDGLDLGGARRLFVKIDVQGAELDVMSGAAGVKDLIAVLQAEASLDPIYVGQPSLVAVIDAAAGLGLRPVGVVNGWIDAASGREISVDVLFAPD
jgi:FkbM family methyltransferase